MQRRGRRIQRTTTAPLPVSDDGGGGGEVTEILSIKERRQRLMAQQKADEEKKAGGGGRRGSRTENKEEEEEQKMDELCKLSLSEKRKLFSGTTYSRPARRKTQPVSLEDLMRAGQIAQQENIPQENQPPPPAAVLVSKWERRMSMTEADEKEKKEEAEDKPESPVLRRRRTSRTILQRVQSFQEGGGGAGEEEEEEKGEREEKEEQPKVNVRELSATFREPQSRGHWVKNEAVARRRSRRLESRFSAVFSCDLGTSEDGEQAEEKKEEKSTEGVRKPKAYGASRHTTEPITKVEMEDLGVCQGKSIKERFASIQSSQDQWKNRLSKADSPEAASRDSPPRRGAGSNLGSRMSMLEESQKGWQGRVAEKSDTAKLRAASVLENRKSQLEDSQQTWKERVEQSDAAQFTVEGRLKKESSPVVVRRSTRLVRGSPRAKSVHDKLEDDSSGHLPKSPGKRRIRRSSTQSDDELDTMKEKKKEKEEEVKKQKEDEERQEREKKEKEEKEKRVVTVPSFDDPQLDSFLSPSKDLDDVLSSSNQPHDLDAFKSSTPKLTGIVKSVRRPGRRSKGNPVRRQKELKDFFVEEYTEVQTGATERQLRAMEVEAQASDTKLAALATREDFSAAAVALRKVKAGDGRRPLSMADLPSHREKMLLMVKGQRVLQIRLVAPFASSLNSGDCFLLVTPGRVFAWIGRFANKMEQARAKDLGGLIVQRKDLGFAGGAPLVEIEEGKERGEAGRAFWAALGEDAPIDVAPPGDIDEDLWFERAALSTNMAFRLEGEELLPEEESWGGVLKKEMLRNDKAYVFDFGSELYVWLGVLVTNEERKTAVRLAQILFNEGYDYSECSLNPLFPLQDEADAVFKAEKRPDWALFARITQNMETLLFKAKFFDWPDGSALVKAKSLEKEAEQDLDPDQLLLQPPPASALLAALPPPAALELEGASVGRAGRWTEIREGLRRTFEVDSQSVRQWSSEDSSEVPPAEVGQLFRASAFVVRWQFRIHVGERRDNRHSSIGRERFAYFYWLGAESSVTDKGATALLTVKLDEEKGPQVRVLEGKEPAALCRILPLLAVHNGRPDDPRPRRSLFTVRGALKEEGHLSEVRLAASSLRSRASFLLVDRKEGSHHHRLWHGSATEETGREVARHVVEQLREKTPSAFALNNKGLGSVQEVLEGEESAAFWRQLGGSREPRPKMEEEGPLRAFRLLSSKARSSGRDLLQASELVSPQHSVQPSLPLPLLQSDLTGLPQPALVLLDGGRKDLLFLWHGWWPRSKTIRVSSGADSLDAESANPEGSDVTQIEFCAREAGSARERFSRERTAALRLAADYGRAKYGEASAAACCYAGMEPEEVKELFPTWSHLEEAEESSKEEGRSPGVLEKVDQLLSRFRSQRFPLSRLQQRPPPEGCDALCLERWLLEEEFETCFGMSRTAFAKLPLWKRNELKKDKHLF